MRTRGAKKIDLRVLSSELAKAKEEYRAIRSLNMGVMAAKASFMAIMMGMLASTSGG